MMAVRFSITNVYSGFIRNWGYLLVAATIWILSGCQDGEKTQSGSGEISQNIASETIDARKWQYVESEDGSQPVARHEAAFVNVGSKFYLLGGRGIRPVSIYDTQSGTWSKGPEPPIELHHFQPVVVEDRIYILGALTGGWPEETPVGHIYTYDTATNTWQQGDAIPEARRRGSTGNVLSGSKIYMLCGIKNGHIGDHKDWADSYDLETGSWEVLSDAPRTRDHFQAVLADGLIYAVAGRNTGSSETPFGGTIGPVDAYHIATDTWTTLPNPIPTERAGTAATFCNGQILIAGGESPVQEKAHSEVEALDPKTGTWQAWPPLNEGRHGTGLVSFDDSLYIASGCGNRGGSPELTTMERLEN